MIKAFCNFVKISVTVLVMTVLLSAISLNDRVQFINVLFDEDPVKFQQTRAKINAMTSLDDVVEFITANFNWDMSSQVVYRFMMAVRRKVNA